MERRDLVKLKLLNLTGKLTQSYATLRTKDHKGASLSSEIKRCEIQIKRLVCDYCSQERKELLD